MTRVLKMALVVWFITDATAYSSYVTDFALTKLPTELANAVSGAGTGLSVGAGTSTAFGSLRATLGGACGRSLGWDGDWARWLWSRLLAGGRCSRA
jgi:hypothetical protein